MTNIANKSMLQSRTEQNKQKQIIKMKSIIEEYQEKLDDKVNQVIHDLITYSKKNNQLILPEIKKNAIQSSSMQKSHRRQKSLIYHTQQYQRSNIKQFAKSFLAKTQLAQAKNQNAGRSVGRQKFKKPVKLQREIQVLSKQMRWNPFSEKNAIKANELDQGILNLIQKGKIGKDVDIITAFQKGTPILNMHRAIFHHGEQRFNRQEELPMKYHRQIEKNLIFNESQMNNNWAITAPQQILTIDRQNVYDSKHVINLNIQQQSIYLQFLHYEVVTNDSLRTVKKIYTEQWGALVVIIRKMQKFLQQYTLEIVYVQLKKLLLLSTLLRKPTKLQFVDCIVTSKQVPKCQLLLLRGIKNKQLKRKKALYLIKSAMIANFYRIQYLKNLKKRKIHQKIYQWGCNSILMKKAKINIMNEKQKRNLQFIQSQQRFKQNYATIIQSKHYEIHLINQNMQNYKYQEYSNTNITRIFNLDNPNTHVIYLCPFQLNYDTTSYYYKIMQLEEIQNYKERVTFMEVDPKNIFSKFNMTCKLYFNTKSLWKLKKKIGTFPAFFIISYPTQLDISLSVHTKYPILMGNLFNASKYQHRTNISTTYELQTLKSLIIHPKSQTLLEISNQIIKFCQSWKINQRFIIKLNQHYQSCGIGLLAYPFTSLPEMYSKTTIIQNKYNIDQFYQKLAKCGGIIQKYDENILPIVVVGRILPDNKPQILGTYDKISYGFVNIGYLFPQKSIPHRQLLPQINKVTNILKEQHFGHFEITFYLDGNNKIYLEKVQLYYTRVGASLYYFKFLSQGTFNNLGQYMTKIFENFEEQNEEMALLQPRGYCYLPYILHFGLSERQSNSFFQLCRMGGVSFDLQNKYGSTFILLGKLRQSVGIITTAKDRKTILKLMVTCLQFVIKQNSYNLSNEMLKQKEIISRQRTNINSVKEVLQSFL